MNKPLFELPNCPCGKIPNGNQEYLLEHILFCKTYSDMLLKEYGVEEVVETLQERCADYIEYTNRAVKLIKGNFCKCQNPTIHNMHGYDRKSCGTCYLIIEKYEVS